MANRQIQDIIVVAHEVFHCLKLRKEGKKAALAMKLDMNKAYDRVEWDFLEAVMIMLGFDKKQVDWTLKCFRTVSYSLIFNG